MTDGELTSAAPRATSVRDDVLRAAQMLANPRPEGRGGTTSDLSIDEVLLLHSMAWEPVDLVFGSAVASVPSGAWIWGQGEITAACDSWDLAFRGAHQRLVGECSRVDGFGVVGVHIECEVNRLNTDIELVGTAVRPVDRGGKKAPSGRPFASDLSARDFVLLLQAGWRPVDLAYGASFAYVPRRTVGTVISQKSQNVELTNFTEAMYSARESAMGRLQDSAEGMGAAGIVDVTIAEGPMHFAHHAIHFTAWGTAIALSAEGHRNLEPKMVLPLDDLHVMFEAATLRGENS